MNKKDYRTGKRVTVWNHTTDGKLIVEGMATVKGIDYREQNDQAYCSVLFDGDDTPVYRWVKVSELNK